MRQIPPSKTIYIAIQLNVDNLYTHARYRATTCKFISEPENFVYRVSGFPSESKASAAREASKRWPLPKDSTVKTSHPILSKVSQSRDTTYLEHSTKLYLPALVILVPRIGLEF